MFHQDINNHINYSRLAPGLISPRRLQFTKEPRTGRIVHNWCLTCRYHLENARIDLVADGIRCPARQQSVVHLVDGRVSENAYAAVARLSEPFRIHVQRLSWIVKLPTIGFGGRIGFDFASDVDVFAAGRSEYDDAVVFANWCVCKWNGGINWIFRENLKENCDF